MPDLKQFLSEEIRRLARKEIKIAEDPLHAVVSAQRKAIFELTRRVKTLEKQLEKMVPAAPREATQDDGDAKKIRLTPKMITGIRSKLGISQKEFAVLLGASTFSVCHWESGKATPRNKQKQKIASFRHVGKRELAKLLAEKMPDNKAVKKDEKTAAVKAVAVKTAAPAPKVEKAVKKAPKAKKAKAVKNAKNVKNVKTPAPAPAPAAPAEQK